VQDGGPTDCDPPHTAYTFTRGWLRRALASRVETAAGTYPPLTADEEETRRRVLEYMERLQ